MPVGALDDMASVNPNAEQHIGEQGSEAYRMHYTSDLWRSSSEVSPLLSNDTTGIRLDIKGRGAGLCAQLLPYEGQTHCNALQIVLENRSACTELSLKVTYGNDTQTTERTVRLQAHSEQKVYYAYLDQVDLIDQVTLTFQGVSDGEVVPYSFSRVSFYEQLPDESIHGTIQKCYYDANEQNVIIQGRLLSDSVVEFSGGRIALYRLSASQDDMDAVNGSLRALQTVKVSNRFTFTVPTTTFAQRNSRYALVLISANGERALLNKPCYPYHQTSEVRDEQMTVSYKGLCSDMPLFGAVTHPGAVIVDVYLDALSPRENARTESYAYENVYHSFDYSYQEELQRRITPHLQIGREVYLRVCVRANQAGYALPYTVAEATGENQPQYLAVCLNTVEAQQAYCATLQYLMDLFSSQRTALAGVILGYSSDNSLQYNYAGMISLQQYLEIVVASLLNTQNVLNGVFPKARLYLPVSDTQYPPYYSSYDLDGIYATGMLMDGVGRMLEDLGQGAFTVHPLLEMRSTPLNLLPEQLQLAEGDDYSMVMLTDQVEAMTPQTLMQPLRDYKSVAESCSVFWIPPNEWDELHWMLSYIYLYNTMQMECVDTFFAYLEQDVATQKLCELISRIDTTYAEQVTKFALPYFDLSSFDFLIQHKKVQQDKKLHIVPLTEETRSVYTGRYAYWNFAASIGTLQWTDGDGCILLSADGGSRYGRALLAQISTNMRGGEILYRFGTPEDFSLCDAVALTAAVTDELGNPVSAKLYLTMYGDCERIEACGTLKDGKMTTLTLTGIPLSTATACHAISVRVEPVDNNADLPLNFYLFNIEGLSRLWDDSTLQSHILEQREIRNASEDERPEFGAYPTLLTIAFLLLIAMGAVLSLRASKQRRINRNPDTLKK
jgi:hypothetical protein